ncbi:unnamed protein product [Phytophthora lilii]|uniref:Unnamed protein product n=1 Tax=Phytophthora lilii TaxID=2077276 RepID=A0A9W6TCK1_9STRA|nr:unnamed protein product [Phytophthora lilii]
MAFGTPDIGAGRQPVARDATEVEDPYKTPLPQTPRKFAVGEDEGEVAGVFSASTEASPLSASGESPERVSEASFEALRGSSFDNDLLIELEYDDSDLTERWKRQIHELSASEASGGPPRLEIAMHLPLGNIKPYYGRRNKSERSLQWLRTFVYKMKGIHTPPNEWCMAFELSLQDGALHWYRQLPRKTRRTWKLLSDAFIKYYCSTCTQSAKARYYSARREDKEHVCDYLNRLNGYGRNAGVQFDDGGRDAKEHVRHFLDTCGDRSLEQRLRYVRVMDIHDLEDLINEILLSEERSRANRETSYRSKGREDSRRRDDRKTEDSRGAYRRDRRD